MRWRALRVPSFAYAPPQPCSITTAGCGPRVEGSKANATSGLGDEEISAAAMATGVGSPEASVAAAIAQSSPARDSAATNPDIVAILYVEGVLVPRSSRRFTSA